MSGNQINERQSGRLPGSLEMILKSVEDQYHSSLMEISSSRPILLVFLRQFGCCFSREALSDIRFLLPAMEAAGARVVLVHMSSEYEASQILASYGLADLSRISNPDGSLYKSFGLRKAELASMLAPQSIGRVLEAWANGNGSGFARGDSMQLPGMFLIYRAKMLQSFAPDSPATRPDYLKIINSGLVLLPTLF